MKKQIVTICKIVATSDLKLARKLGSIVKTKDLNLKSNIKYNGEKVIFLWKNNEFIEIEAIGYATL